MAYEIDYMAVGDGEKGGDAIALRFGNLTGPRDAHLWRWNSAGLGGLRGSVFVAIPRAGHPLRAEDQLRTG